ncbi:MAG: DUF3465 domain-containing protein [Candidatus Obscuribacterales bacterium]|nr:DUF3465 domain-containing protein [Candidatus Obscuribacterales bacterium]
MKSRTCSSFSMRRKRSSDENPDRHLLKTGKLVLLSIAAVSILSSCSAPVVSPEQRAGNFGQAIRTPEQAQQVATADQGQAEILNAQAQGAQKVELIFTAPVKKLLPDDRRGLPHQLFLLELQNGSTVKIAHDTKYAPHIPLSPGDVVTVKGEYIWNKKGGVVHWTHHSDTPKHEGGYIDFNGRRYE